MKDRKLLNIELGRITPEEYGTRPSSGAVLVLDNVRSAHNVGSAFRSADAFHADSVYLCGITSCPPSADIHKTALGAESSVPWRHFGDTLDALAELRGAGYTLVAVEQTEHSLSLERFAPYSCLSAESSCHSAGIPSVGRKFAFVFGNEVDGVQQAVVDACDFSLEIPQFGTKHSLNVSVSVGVVLWQYIASRLIR